MERGRRQLPMHRALAALRARLGCAVRELLDQLEPLLAGVAQILVKGHASKAFVRPYSSAASEAVSPRSSWRCAQNGALPPASTASWKPRSEYFESCCSLKSSRSFSIISLPIE